MRTWQTHKQTLAVAKWWCIGSPLCIWWGSVDDRDIGVTGVIDECGVEVPVGGGGLDENLWALPLFSYDSDILTDGLCALLEESFWPRLVSTWILVELSIPFKAFVSIPDTRNCGHNRPPVVFVCADTHTNSCVKKNLCYSHWLNDAMLATICFLFCVVQCWQFLHLIQHCSSFCGHSCVHREHCWLLVTYRHFLRAVVQYPLYQGIIQIEWIHVYCKHCSVSVFR